MGSGRSVFSNPSKVSGLNDTLISLIPKIDPVVNMMHFRPINLCNVSYKTVTKILSARLIRVMEELVDPYQCSFIPNRHIGNNISIAQGNPLHEK